MHVLGDDQLVGIADHLLLLGEEARDDAGNLTAVIEGRACHLAHQAEAAAAVDEADVVRGEIRAERACGGRVGGIFAEAGAAVDADAAYAGGRCSGSGFRLPKSFLAH